MNCNSRLTWLLALSALAAMGSALDGSPTKLVVKVGDVRHYKTTATINDGKMLGHFTSDVAQRVASIGADGQVTLVNTPSNVVLKIGPVVDPDGSQTQTIPTGEPKPITEIHSADGALVSLHGDSVKPELYRLTFLESIKFPSAPLAKDKTWTWDIPADPATGVLKTKVDFTVLGDEKVDGIDCWKISRNARETGGEGDSPASTEGTIWIDKSNGMMVKRVDNWKNMPINGIPPPKEATTTIELQP